jgi:hypothetical protein
VRNLEGNSIEICEEPIGSPGSPTSRVIAGNRETELIRGRFFYPSAESGATCTPLFAEHGFLTIRFRLIQALRFAARWPSAERRGFFSTSLPSAYPPHRAKIGLRWGAPDALGSIISPCGLLSRGSAFGPSPKARHTRPSARDLWRMEGNVRNRTGRLEVVQCPSSLFISLMKSARMRYHLLIK